MNFNGTRYFFACDRCYELGAASGTLTRPERSYRTGRTRPCLRSSTSRGSAVSADFRGYHVGPSFVTLVLAGLQLLSAGLCIRLAVIAMEASRQDLGFYRSLSLSVAPVAYQVILEHGVGQFREFESPRVHTGYSA